MKKQHADVLKLYVGTMLFLLLSGLLGASDKNDAIVAEMKNNGAYWELAEQYPQASEKELIDLYYEKDDR